MAKEIIKTRTSKNAETLGALYIYIYIYISIFLQTNGICILNNTHKCFYRKEDRHTWKSIISTEQNNNKNIVIKKYISNEVYFIDSTIKRMDYVAK